MSIEKRKNKKGSSFRVRIFESGLVVKEKSFTTKSMAIEWERKEKTNLQKKKAFPETPIPESLRSVFDSWINCHATIHKAASSVVKDRQMFRDYIQPFFGEKLVNEIYESHIFSFITELKSRETISNSSINKILQLFKTLLNFCLRKRMIPFNPMTGIKLLPVDDEAFKFWTRDESSKFLSFANAKYLNEDRWKYGLYLLLLTTGLRIREATGLYWDCIHFDRGIIEISHSHDRFTKKIKVGTKGKKKRYVPINSELMQVLQHMKTTARSRLVFPGKALGILDADSFRKRNFYRDIQEAGVRKIKIHDLRHTFASNYVMAGGSLNDLMSILGHADYKMTLRYAHLSPAHIASKSEIVKFDTGLLLNKTDPATTLLKHESRSPIPEARNPYFPYSPLML